MCVYAFDSAHEERGRSENNERTHAGTSSNESGVLQRMRTLTFDSAHEERGSALPKARPTAERAGDVWRGTCTTVETIAMERDVHA